MEHWFLEKTEEQLSRIYKLIVEPVEPQNEVQRFAAKIRSVLGNFISFISFQSDRPFELEKFTCFLTEQLPKPF